MRLELFNSRGRPIGWGQVAGVKELESHIHAARTSMEYWKAEADKFAKDLDNAYRNVNNYMNQIESLEKAIDKLVRTDG